MDLLTAKAVSVFVLLLLCVAGCGSSPSEPNAIRDQYTLWMTLEKDLQHESNTLVLEFKRNDSGFTEWAIAFDEDTVRPCALSCLRRRQMPADWWPHGSTVHFTAIDELTGFKHRDSVLMPGAVSVAGIEPTDRHWDGDSISVYWEEVPGAFHYAISVRSQDYRSNARGHGDYAPEGATMYRFGSDAFRLPGILGDELEVGVHLVRVVCSSENFMWLLPWFDDMPPPYGRVPDSIKTSNLIGAVSAIVVSPYDSIIVGGQ